jgi:hypothetical protein
MPGMTCHFEHDEAGNLKRIACGHPWGIGTITLHGEAAEDYGDCMYGYPKADTKPEDFRPDLECCTPEEVLRWRAAMDQVEE